MITYPVIYSLLILLIIVVTAAVLYQIYIKDKLIVPNYFTHPVDKDYRLDWILKQTFLLLNEEMSDRWFESRCHLSQSFLVSFLCALKLLNVVYITYETNEQNVFTSETFVLYGIKTKQMVIIEAWGLKSKISYKNKDLNPSYFQTFIAGYNVVEGHMCL